MPSNVWNDVLWGTDQDDLEELGMRSQEMYRSASGLPGWGRPYYLDQYDGLEPNLHVQALDTTESLFALLETHDSAVRYQGDNDGHDFDGPWDFAGAGTITGNVGMTGNLNLTGTLHVTGAVDFDSTLNVDGAVTLQNTLRVVGAVDFDSSLNVDGAAVFQSTANVVGNFSVNTNKFTVTASNGNTAVAGTLAVAGAATLDGNVTLGDAAGDTITVTGTATFAEDLTLSKGLIVDTTTLVVEETNNKVGVGVAVGATSSMFEVAGAIRATNNAGVATAGSGCELVYNTTSNFGNVIAFDRGGAAYLDQRVTGLSVALYASSTERIKVDGTGMGFFATTPVAQPAAAAAATDLASVITLANSLRTGLRAATGLGLFS